MGAGLPTQGPGTTLPGAEYFALAPNRNIALGPRIAIQNTTAPANVVAPGTSATPTNSGIVDPNFTYGAGVYIVRAYGLFVPSDTSGELQIVSARMGLGIAPGNFEVDLGTPVSILSSPLFSQIFIYERDLLVTSQDIPNFVPNQPLSLILQIGVHNNDATNSHTFLLGFTSSLHRLSGFVQ